MTLADSFMKTIKWTAVALAALVSVGVAYYAYLILSFDTEALPENHGKVNTVLYLGDGENQPLLVGFGGAEGGNAWTRRYLRPQLERFLEQGYAFLAIAYFGEDGIPADVDRIALDGVHAAIVEAARHPQINGECIALIGGSKGAELALALASHYPDIKAVAAIVPGHAVFPAHTIAMNTSSFSLHGEPLPFVPMTWSAVPALLKRDLRSAWNEMLKNEEAVQKALIPVERINGPIFLLSAARDEFWPSAEMSQSMIRRLEKHAFPHAYEHVAIDGDHQAPQRRPQLVEAFLREHFLTENAMDCPR